MITQGVHQTLSSRYGGDAGVPQLWSGNENNGVSESQNRISFSMITCYRYSFLPNMQIVAPTEIYVPGIISIYVTILWLVNIFDQV